MLPNPEVLRARFKELQEKQAAIRALSAPIREERERITNEARERELPLIARVREIEAELPAIGTELAMIARALGGKTG